VRRSLRQPAVVVPTIVFPLILLAVNAAGFADAVRIPGFPDDNYLDFAIAVCFMQAGLFASTTAGTEIAHDIETGFLDRLSLTPMRGIAVLTGQLAGAVAVAFVGSIAYLIAGFAAGLEVEAGVGGVVVLMVLGIVVALAFAGLGAMLGLATGSGEAVQGFFPLMFVTFFLSSISLPRELIEIDWFRTVATYNPISYLVEGLRSLVIFGWDGTALARGFAAAAAMSALAFAGASRLLSTRMART
jgi:ABC-2 type transport system permease protein